MGNKKKGKMHNEFYWGKGIPKTDKGNSPIKGQPNTNLDFYNKDDGKFRRRRKFGVDGCAVKDLDVATGSRKNDHAHDWYGAKRSRKRSTTSSERREINKAKRKRKWW